MRIWGLYSKFVLLVWSLNPCKIPLDVDLPLFTASPPLSAASPPLFPMLSLAKRIIQPNHRFLQIAAAAQVRHARTDAGTDRPPRRRRSKFSPSAMLRKPVDKSEWWIVDGEMHEIGENVPLRERFVIPRDNVPNRRRKQLREQFMRRTRLVLKEAVSSLLILISLIYSWIFLLYILSNVDSSVELRKMWDWGIVKQVREREFGLDIQNFRNLCAQPGL